MGGGRGVERETFCLLFTYFLHVQLLFVALSAAAAAAQLLFAVVVRSVYASIDLLTIAWQLLVPIRLEGVYASKAIAAMSSSSLEVPLEIHSQAIQQIVVVVAATAATVLQLLLVPSACVY